MTKKKTKIDVRLLRKVQRHILEEPRRFIMSTFIALHSSDRNRYEEIYDLDSSATPWQYPACGTAACIGGWAYILNGGNPARLSNTNNTGAVCARALGLSKEEAQRLFHVGTWPNEFSIPYQKATTPEATATIAAQRIEHFIKTKGRE